MAFTMTLWRALPRFPFAGGTQRTHLRSSRLVERRGSSVTAQPAPFVPLVRRVAVATGRSVRHARRVVVKGLVRVDGVRCTDLTALVSPSNHVQMSLPVKRGCCVQEAPHPNDFYLKLFKPRGVICSHRRQPRDNFPVVSELFPEGAEGLHFVGRLDGQSEGLLLLTTDGTFTRYATMPEVHVEKEYLAVTGCWSYEEFNPPSPETLQRLVDGVELHDGPARAEVAELVECDGKLARLKIVVTSGRFHMVRRMLKAVGYGCWALLRTRVGSITGAVVRPPLHEVPSEHKTQPLEMAPAQPGDPDTLQPGEYAALTGEEIVEIYKRGLAWVEEQHPV